MLPIYGYQKTTLLDYPGHLASTIFLGHCNFRCPFCHNSSLLCPTATTVPIPWDSIQSHLKKRAHILQGVCITGGEPTLYPGLPSLLHNIKSLGYQIKLDTNGTNPDMVASLIQEQLVDMIAMDIKNSPLNYAKTIGRSSYDLTPIKESISLLHNSSIAYEFRTTVVKELHTAMDLCEIAQWIPSDSFYFLQNYTDSPDVLLPGFHGFSLEELRVLQAAALPFVPNTKLRGVDG